MLESRTVIRSKMFVACVCAVTLALPLAAANPVDVAVNGDGVRDLLNQVSECNGKARIDHIVPVPGNDVNSEIRSGYMATGDFAGHKGLFIHIGLNPNAQGEYLYWMNGTAPGLRCVDRDASPPWSQFPTILTCQLIGVLERQTGSEYGQCKYSGEDTPL